MGHMTEKHGNQLRQTGDAFGAMFCLMLSISANSV